MNSTNGKDNFSMEQLSTKEKELYYAFLNKYEEEEREEKALKAVTEIYQKGLIKERLYLKSKKRKRKALLLQLAKIASIILILGGSWGIYNYYTPTQIIVAGPPSETIDIPNSPKKPSIIDTTGGHEEIKDTIENPPLPIIIEPSVDSDAIIPIYVLNRIEITEEEVFGGENDVFDFVFNFNPAQHLATLPTLQDAFKTKNYRLVNTILKNKMAQNATNQELQFFKVVNHLLSKQRIQPNKQLKILNQLKLPPSLEADVNWCYAYLYYRLEQRQSFQFIKKLNGTTYQENGQKLKKALEEVIQ